MEGLEEDFWFSGAVVQKVGHGRKIGFGVVEAGDEGDADFYGELGFEYGFQI